MMEDGRIAARLEFKRAQEEAEKSLEGALSSTSYAASMAATHRPPQPLTEKEQKKMMKIAESGQNL